MEGPQLIWLVVGGSSSQEGLSQIRGWIRGCFKELAILL